MNKLALFFAILLVASQGAHAKTGREASLISIDGSVDFEGSDSFYVELVGGETGDRYLVVESEYLRVELDHDYTDFYTGSNNNENPNTTVFYEGPGKLYTNIVRDQHRLTVVAEEVHASVQSQGATIRPKESDTVARSGGEGPDRGGADGVEHFTLGPQFQMVGIDGRVDLQGTFSFNLRHWDGIVEHPDGRDDFWTGSRYEPLHDAMGGVEYGGKKEWQTAYVFVEDGTMSFEARGSDTQSYAMGSALSTIQGDVKMESGTSESNYDGLTVLSLQAPRVNVLTAAIQDPSTKPGTVEPSPSEDSSPEREVSATTPEKTASARPTATITPAPTPDAAPPWLWLLLIPLLAAAAVAYVLLRPGRRMSKLEDAYDLGIHDYVLDNAERLVKNRRHGRTASMMYTMGLLEKRGPDEAEEHLRMVDQRSRPQGATYEYLMARIRAAQTRFDEARQHVHACLEAEPAFILEIKRHATLDFLARPASDPREGYV